MERALAVLPQTLELVKAIKLAHDKLRTVFAKYSLLVPGLPDDSDKQPYSTGDSNGATRRIRYGRYAATAQPPTGPANPHQSLALHQRNVHLAFAIGRHLLEIRILRQRITLPAWLITGNGTRVHDLDSYLLFASALSPSMAEEMLHSRWESTATVHVFNDDGWFTDVLVPQMLQAHALSGFHYQLRDLKSFPAHEVTKICFVDDHDALCPLKSQLKEALSDRAHICF